MSPLKAMHKLSPSINSGVIERNHCGNTEYIPTDCNRFRQDSNSDPKCTDEKDPQNIKAGSSTDNDRCENNSDYTLDYTTYRIPVYIDKMLAISEVSDDNADVFFGASGHINVHFFVGNRYMYD